MSEAMALYGPHTRIGGYPRLTPPSERTRSLEIGLERLYSLFMRTMARYIESLDDDTPDTDLEPSLAMTEHNSGLNGRIPVEYFTQSEGAMDDREADGDWAGGARCSDEEPSLGSVGGTAKGGAKQIGWGFGVSGFFYLDAEIEHDGREPGCEDEGAQCDDEGDRSGCLPSPAYADEHNQTRVAGCWS